MLLKSVISLSLLTSILLAQSQDVDELFNLSLEELMDIEVTTTSKYEEKASDSPANIHVFTREMIRERGYQSVEDILQALPGVDIQKFARPLSYSVTSIRGTSGQNKFLIMLNGVRISSPAGSNVAIGHNFPIYHAKQVEVLMGAASVMYGADAFLGVINIVTQSDEDLIEMQASAGSDGYLNSYANLSQTMDNGYHINASITGYRSQEYKFDEDFPSMYPSNEPANVEDGYDFSPTEDLTFFANISNENFEFGANHYEHKGSLNFIVKPDKSAFDEDSMDQSRITTIYSKLKFDLTNNLHSETMLSYQRLEKDHDTYFKNSFSNYQKAYKYAKTEKYTLTQDFHYELDEHVLSLGLLFEDVDVIPRGPDLGEKYDISKSSNKQDMYYMGTNIPIDFNEYDYNNYGIYLQDNYTINDDLHLIVGSRYDVSTFYDNTFTPRASLIYKPSEKDIFKLMYSESFLAPGSEQIYNEYGTLTYNNTTGLYESKKYHIKNEDLQPERLKTLEFNYEHFFSTNTHLKIAPYYTMIDDVILEKDNPGANDTTTIPGALLKSTRYYDNIGESTIYGIDISLDDVSTYNNFTFKSWINASYTHSELEVDNKDTDTPLYANYKMKAGSTIIYNSKIYVTPKIYWIGATNTAVFKENSDTQRKQVPTYFLTDLNLQYKLTKNLSLTSDIYNLFDKRYVNASAAASENFMYREAAQPGRIITAGLYYKF
jgi:iron complex outermembrane receptor protein